MGRREKQILGSLTALLPISLALVLWARNFPDQVEQLYSLGFYPLWGGFLSQLTSPLPFSLAELLVIAGSFLAILLAVQYLSRMLRHKEQRLALTCQLALRLLGWGSLVTFLFTLGGGLNYYRYTFTYYSGLEPAPSQVLQLRDLCAELRDQANLLREGLPEDGAGVFTFADGSTASLATTARDHYRALGTQNPQWEPLLSLGSRVLPKGVFFSQVMSYLQITGFFFPYTMEANVNLHTTNIDIPFTMCHELSHISGFMREDEANFLAYLACMAGESREFAYSGTVQALIHAGNALHSKNQQLYYEVMEEVSPAVRRDLDADAQYYYAHQTPVGDFSRSVNDVYLRVNNQTDGVDSYGRMVDLMLADYRLRHGLD